jgi:cysteine-rich repeat protein
MQAMEECDDGNMDDTDACTNLCLNAVCGDGFMQAGVEECDDGNLDDTDACPSTCLNAFCGDGFTQVDVEACDDANMDDTDACLTSCVAASCGDGLIQAGVEQCDDANMDNADDCVDGCLAATCGDGFQQAGVEECDDGGMNGGCTEQCTWLTRFAFVTSSLYTGNMGGIAGADAECNMRAQAAGLPGTYMAWLSDNQVTPASRFVQSSVPYLKTNGAKIADNWADLIDSTLDSPLDTTEQGTPSPDGGNSCNASVRQVFTGTFSNGLVATNTCSNWTSEAGQANIGQTTSATFRWSNCGSTGSCAAASAIYCFQQ